jgi:hypothetical protein
MEKISSLTNFMNKLNSVVLVLIVSIPLIGCDPLAKYVVEVKSPNDVLIEIHPSLEAKYCPDNLEMCKLAKSHKVREVEGGAVYQLKQGEIIGIYIELGGRASIEKFPFQYMKIIRKSDTLMLNGKNQILEKFIRKGKLTSIYYKFEL